MGETVQEQSKELIYKANVEIANEGNLDMIPQHFAKDFVMHFLPDDTQVNGLTALRDRIDHLRGAFPDWTEKIMLMAAEGDLLASWSRSTGTNTGHFNGRPPTGNRIVINDMSIFRITDGKIAEQWFLPDLFSLNSQLGLIPAIEPGEIARDRVTPVQADGSEKGAIDILTNKEIALKANDEVWNQGRFENLEEIFAVDFIQHLLPFGIHTTGLEEFHRSSVAHREAFPDWKEVVNLVVGEGHFVALQYASTGTNTGRFLGNPPTGKKIHISEMTIFRVVEAKIAEHWLLPDILSLNQQLGLIRSGN